ncbi:UDP-N-acetylglucosamine 1-carboxyvinyltransferase 1 [Oxobacter pfennigii]|uniref:UDP-N-acetylglucosamine 1-carboxyvinyltransferase n=1 Tax=Oxobacter pfennigii TaxID=36849 RepID=A0A0P8YBY5_9CLOT|nr:UDP-N-acetylglucosamine 1-carboxyvinyltransferase [Oxobacter pfennigii]KPU44623.1 UDP-N-acetylglucosamine 1-carboxyvinyltransferase 1 [Oxobacter pfennigii]
MAKLLITGGERLHGTVKVSGAKNSVLPIIAASLLCPQDTILEDIPALEDVLCIREVLDSLGVNTEFTKDKLVIKSGSLSLYEPPYELVRKMRASFLVIGPLLARMGKVRISLPGGCNIGTRPIDLHLKGLSALGADITLGHGYVEANVDRLKGAKIYLDFPSVGATENIIMASALAEGETVIENAAEEPEIVDLANFLNSMGANIIGAGTDTVKITGVKELKGTYHSVIPDRIEAGTYMAAAAITGGDIVIENIIKEHVKSIVAKLTEAGVKIAEEDNYRIRVTADKRMNPVDIKTLPYPGFPTDLQAPMMAVMSKSCGTSIITETVFENRFMHVCELKRMGANVKIEGRSAVIEGVERLTGAKVKATDLRAGAALLLCGLAAEGKTEISDIYHISRGYVDIKDKLNNLGACIEEVEE